MGKDKKVRKRKNKNRKKRKVPIKGGLVVRLAPGDLIALGFIAGVCVAKKG